MASAAPPTPTSEAEKKVAEDKPVLNEREQNLLLIAITQCLKGGFPEIDYNKFMKHGDFNTMKTTQNSWGKIKQKLRAMLGPESEDGDEDGTTKASATPKTKASPRKRGKAAAVAAAEDDGAEEGSPAAKKRKPSPKKAATATVKAEPEDNAPDAPFE